MSSGDMILRGAYGIYYDQPLVGIFEQNAFTTPPFVNNISLTGRVRAQQSRRGRDRDHLGRRARSRRRAPTSRTRARCSGTSR